MSRDYPAPRGVPAVVRGLTLLVAHVIRPADAEIERANQFNPDPEPGNEYVMVELVLTCKKDSDETCLVSPAFDLELAGSKGIVREPDIFIAGVPHMLERTEFFGGVTVSGWLIFEVGQDETDLVLAYEPTFGLSRAHLAVP